MPVSAASVRSDKSGTSTTSAPATVDSVASSTGISAAGGARLTLGSRVHALFYDGDEWFPGKIVGITAAKKIGGANTYDIMFVILVPLQWWSLATRCVIFCVYKSCVRSSWIPRYDTGDREERVPRERVHDSVERAAFLAAKKEEAAWRHGFKRSSWICKRNPAWTEKSPPVRLSVLCIMHTVFFCPGRLRDLLGACHRSRFVDECSMCALIGCTKIHAGSRL